MGKKGGFLRYADGMDKLLLVFGTLGCIGDGLQTSVTMLVLGSLIDDYADHTSASDNAAFNHTVDKVIICNQYFCSMLLGCSINRRHLTNDIHCFLSMLSGCSILPLEWACLLLLVTISAIPAHLVICSILTMHIQNISHVVISLEKTRKRAHVSVRKRVIFFHWTLRRNHTYKALGL